MEVSEGLGQQTRGTQDREYQDVPGRRPLSDVLSWTLECRPGAQFVVHIPGEPVGSLRSQEDASLEGQHTLRRHLFQRVARAYVPAISDAEGQHG